MTRQPGCLPTRTPDNSAIGLVQVSDAYGNLSWQPVTTPDLPLTQLDERYGRVFSVLAYGATGNGTTDDTTAIKAAITALNAAGGGILYFPAGTYLISSALPAGGGSPGAMVITGEGWNSQIKLASAANAYIFDLGLSGSPQYTPGLVIRDLYLNCNGASQSTAGGGIFARGAVWCVFDHLWIETPWEAGIRFYQDGTGSNGHHNTIRDCLFRDGKNSDGGQGWAIKFEQADENTVTGTTFQDNGVQLGAGHDAQVYDTSAGLQTLSGCHFVGGGTGVPMIFSNSSPGRLVLQGCHFDGPNGADCVILNGTGNVVSGNQFLGIGNGAASTVSGVHIGGTSGTTVTGNQFYSSGAHAAAVSEDSGAGPNILAANKESGTWAAGAYRLAAGGGTVTSPVTPGYESAVAADAPLLWWKLADATGASPVADASGNGHTGTPTAVTLGTVRGPMPGETGCAFSLFGQSNSGIVSSYTLPSLSAVTVEVWLNVINKSLAGTPRLCANSHTDSDNKGFQFILSSSASIYYPGIYFGNGTTNSFCSGAGAALPLNGWVHLAATWDGTTVTLYQDGVPTGSASLSGSLATSSTAVGAGYNPTYNGDYMTGLLGQFAIYATALTQARVSAHYLAGPG